MLIRSLLIGIALLCSQTFCCAQHEDAILQMWLKQNSDVDHITIDVLTELRKLLPTDSSRASLELEQALWQSARTKQCHQEARSYPRKERKQREQECLYKAATKRLDELLIRYDELYPN